MPTKDERDQIIDDLEDARKAIDAKDAEIAALKKRLNDIEQQQDFDACVTGCEAEQFIAKLGRADIHIADLECDYKAMHKAKNRWFRDYEAVQDRLTAAEKLLAHHKNCPKQNCRYGNDQWCARAYFTDQTKESKDGHRNHQ